MGFLDLAPQVSAWSADQVRDFLTSHHPDSYTLLDVRQPREFAPGHLPGAINLPLDVLLDRLPELDGVGPVIVYCQSGMRSHAAAAALARAGYHDVHHLAGGLHAWEGELAAGHPAVELERFQRYTRPTEHAALAWCLEEGTRRFYAAAAEQAETPELGTLFGELVNAEEGHKKMLRGVYEALRGALAPDDFPACELGAGAADDYMEGGMEVAEAIAWARQQPARAILELAMAVETSALDRYLYLQRRLPDENSQRVFELLADEERRHLKQLAAGLERLL
ncbi:rhodanese-like domain-containing protein [Desulfuromonas carbonis]|uniref:rhodanese-like domain-containing protein n=1 Tax=Desulfuromonas sp. DDH964 TaxID=1823759 RepID=UPI00078D4622|nr:rhodanese-like domain-containing protein [Desulfuromonas sp. DDH964]AMV72802.1 hypothetical protein DBW_2472 [Desulfuromonas sp. DDH964]